MAVPAAFSTMLLIRFQSVSGSIDNRMHYARNMVRDTVGAGSGAPSSTCHRDGSLSL